MNNNCEYTICAACHEMIRARHIMIRCTDCFIKEDRKKYNACEHTGICIYYDAKWALSKKHMSPREWYIDYTSKPM